MKTNTTDSRRSEHKNEDVEIDDIAVLRCPDCGGEYLHCEKIDVFEHSTDAMVTAHTTIETHHHNVEYDQKSQRDPGFDGLRLRIHFGCEDCDDGCEDCDEDGTDHDRVLSILNTNGMTYTRWE